MLACFGTVNLILNVNEFSSVWRFTQQTFSSLKIEDKHYPKSINNGKVKRADQEDGIS